MPLETEGLLKKSRVKNGTGTKIRDLTSCLGLSSIAFRRNEEGKGPLKFYFLIRPVGPNQTAPLSILDGEFLIYIFSWMMAPEIKDLLAERAFICAHFLVISKKLNKPQSAQRESGA